MACAQTPDAGEPHSLRLISGQVIEALNEIRSLMSLFFIVVIREGAGSSRGQSTWIDTIRNVYIVIEWTGFGRSLDTRLGWFMALHMVFQLHRLFID